MRMREDVSLVFLFFRPQSLSALPRPRGGMPRPRSRLALFPAFTASASAVLPRAYVCLEKNASAKSVQGLLQDFGYGGQCPLAA